MSFRTVLHGRLTKAEVVGGESSINNIEQGDSHGNFRMGITFSAPVSKKQSVKLAVNTGVTTRAGQNYNAVTSAYQYIWF